LAQFHGWIDPLEIFFPSSLLVLLLIQAQGDEDATMTDLIESAASTIPFAGTVTTVPDGQVLDHNVWVAWQRGGGGGGGQHLTEMGKTTAATTTATALKFQSIEVVK
jgi:hypothetical protein